MIGGLADRASMGPKVFTVPGEVFQHAWAGLFYRNLAIALSFTAPVQLALHYTAEDEIGDLKVCIWAIALSLRVKRIRLASERRLFGPNSCDVALGDDFSCRLFPQLAFENFS